MAKIVRNNDGTFGMNVISTGDTTLTIRVGDYVTTKEITVYHVPVTSIEISDLPATMHTLFNPTHQISVTVNPSDASYPDCYYESSNPNVASIDQYGLITAHSAGQTYISVRASHDDVEAGFWVDVQGILLDYNVPENNCISVGETFRVADDPVTTISARTPGIVRINGDGTITGLSVGKTVIEVSYPSLDYCEEFELVVTKDFVITDIPTGEIYPGAIIKPGIEGEVASSDTFVWYTSDSTIASFDKNEIDGVVLTCHKPGDVYVGFTIGNSGIGEEVFLSIKAPTYTVSLEDNSETNIMYEGEKRTFTLKINTDPVDVSTSYMNISWDLGNDFTFFAEDTYKCGIEAINESTNQNTGSKIIITIDGQKYEFYRIIKRPRVTITNAPTEQLLVGDTHQLGIAKTEHAQLAGWSSSDSSIAYVNSNNQIVALNPGTVTITAHTKNTINGEVYPSSTITVVVYQPVQSVVITNFPENNEIKIGETFNLDAVVTPANASNQNITWSISNPDIATINPITGVVTAISVGEVTVTAIAVDGKSKQYVLSIIGNWTVCLTNTENPNINIEYNRNDAKEYIDQYYINYNDKYISFKEQEADCANYTSQILYESGLDFEGKPVDVIEAALAKTHTYRWYYDERLINEEQDITLGISNTWSLVPAFRKYWGKKDDGTIGRCYQYIEYSCAEDVLTDLVYLANTLHTGDIVLYIDPNGEVGAHNMIVYDTITTSGSEDIRFSGHTEDKYHDSFKDIVLEDPKYANVTICIIRIKEGA